MLRCASSNYQSAIANIFISSSCLLWLLLTFHIVYTVLVCFVQIECLPYNPCVNLAGCISWNIESKWRLFEVMRSPPGDYDDGCKENESRASASDFERISGELQQKPWQRFSECFVVFTWHMRCKTDRTSVDDDHHTGRSSTCTAHENVTEIQQLMHANPHPAIRERCEAAGTGLWRHTGRFSLILASQPNLFPWSSRLTECRNVLIPAQASTARLRGWNFLLQARKSWWKLALMLWFGDKANRPGGKVQGHQDPERPDSRRAWWSLSRELCAKNLSLLARPWLPASAVVFSGNCVTIGEGDAPGLWQGNTIGCFTVKLTPFSECSPPSSPTWPTTTWLSSTALLICQIWRFKLFLSLLFSN